MDILIVTRHEALVTVLAEDFGIRGRVVAHATAEDVHGRHVYGVLPLELAALAACVTALTLNIPAEKRGVELSVEEVRAYMGELRTFVVRTVQRQAFLLNDALDAGYQGAGGTYTGREL